jgi:DNA invertase Pin-like site-specific DNA recombinase
MKVAGYVRTSTRKQDLEGQRRAIEEWAAREGARVRLFEDDHVSGRRADRSGIGDMIAGAERGEFDKVAVTELSRIGRSLSFVHKTIERLAVKGVKIVLVNSGSSIDPNSLEGKALLGALALAAEIEWHLIQERNARGRATIKARGVRVGRKPREVSAAAIAALREKGLSLRAIARELKVSPATLSRRLRNDGGTTARSPPGRP